MFGFTIRFTKKRLFIFFSALIIPAILFSAYTLGENKAKPAVNLNADSKTQRIDFLENYGWEPLADSETVKKTVIPIVFDKVYSRYNELQLSQGFDLTKLKGQTIKVYSIKINNYPDDSEYVFATLLVKDGKIVGGDIHSTALNGFMHGFKIDWFDTKFLTKYHYLTIFVQIK